MAPPKRKTVGGRTTEKGTQPGEVRRVRSSDELDSNVAASSRYTPPASHKGEQPIPWVPYVMVALLVLGMVVIMLRNLVFTGNNWLTLVGLACILGGLFAATKWR